ncbi:hypothetical protein GCM10027037_18360 [Mucilaginibacter koreensis]
MKQNNYNRYFRVFMYDTAVTEISTNDFKPVNHQLFVRRVSRADDFKDHLCQLSDSHYSLPVAEQMFYGYMTRIRALEKAKAGAQKYINELTRQAEASINQLKQYRMAHYQDLSSTLLEANIRRLEKELNIK